MNKSSYPRLDLKEILTASRTVFIYVGLFSFFINLLMLTVPIYMLQVFDRVLASYSYDTLILLTVIALIALLVFALLDAARAKLMSALSYWFLNQLSPIALERGADFLLYGNSYGSQSLNDIRNIYQF